MANYKTGAERRNDRMHKIFETAQKLNAERDKHKFDYRIRRCSGNKAYWYIAALRPDQTEIEVMMAHCTGTVDFLLKYHAAALTGKKVELLLD